MASIWSKRKELQDEICKVEGTEVTGMGRDEEKERGRDEKTDIIGRGREGKTEVKRIGRKGKPEIAVRIPVKVGRSQSTSWH